MFKDAFSYDWQEQQQKWQDLLNFPLTPENKQFWMDLWDDLERNCAEQKARLHWDSMADVESPEPLERFKTFSQEVVPQVMGFQRQIYQRWVAFSEDHPTPGWEVTTRYLKHLQHEQETIPELLQQEEQLIMTYYNLSGVDRPVPSPFASADEMFSQMESAEAQKRQQALLLQQSYWRPVWDHRAKVYLELIKLRQEQAKRLGLQSPVQLAWERLRRQDFTLEQWRETRAAVLKQARSLMERVFHFKALGLGLTEFTLFDQTHPGFSCISEKYSKTELGPFHDGMEALFRAFSPELADLYRQLLTEGHLDLEDRKSKTTQPFADVFPVSRKPGTMLTLDQGVDSCGSFFHEMGHVLHFHEMLQRHPVMLLDPSAKFLEFVAHVFELYGAWFADQSGLFDARGLQVLKVDMLTYRIQGMVRAMMIDLWEEWVYTQPAENLTREHLEERWLEIVGEHHPQALMLPESAANMWSVGWHVRVPLGRARYAIADLCALEFSSQIREDPHQAFERLREGMRLGGKLPFLGLIQACGLQFDFTARAVERALEQFEGMADFWGLSESASQPESLTS